MPYKSKAQAAYLHIHEPKIAARWDKEYGKTGPLPDHVRRRKAALAIPVEKPKK